MTELVTSITASNLAELRERASEAFASGSDWVELRLDHLDSAIRADEVAAFLKSLDSGRWVATLRSVAEGGRSHTSPGERLEYLREAMRGCAGWVDIEHQLWRSASELRRAILPVACNADRDDVYPRPIFSWHDFGGSPGDTGALLGEMLAAHPKGLAKIAWMGQNLCDNVEAFELMRAGGGRAIAIVMGEAGLASRVLAKKFGAAATFCALDQRGETAPGQLTLGQMRDLFRWDVISPTTRLFGVLGDPVRHSLGPVVFNGAFARASLDAVYVPLLAAGGEQELCAFLRECESRPWLDAGGFSVTLPHKESARRYVGDRADALAARIGAVNTLAMKDGRFWGFNTDYAGALDALSFALNCTRSELRAMPVDVLGAGGAARAVVAGLSDCACRVTIFNRSFHKAEALAQEFGCSAEPWEQRTRADRGVVINCTSVGMLPRSDDSPLPPEGLRQGTLVFDTVYNPVETRLLREAKAAGCATLSGVELFVRQAAAQYQIWFGATPDVDQMRRTVLHEVGSRKLTSIILIGYRGSGKTTVGRVLADRLRRPFLDTDEEIVRRAGKPIAAIFAEDGEPAFRELEAAVIRELAGRPLMVLSVGGGAVLRDDNVERLRACGSVVWLQADAGMLWSRTARDAASGEQRPALTRLAGVQEVRQVLAEREPLYRRAAHHQVDASCDNPAEVAHQIIACMVSSE